jgi:hypothetical protein
MFSGVQFGLPLGIIAVLVRREAIFAAFKAAPLPKAIFHADLKMHAVRCSVFIFDRRHFVFPRHYLVSSWTILPERHWLDLTKQILDAARK